MRFFALASLLVVAGACTAPPSSPPFSAAQACHGAEYRQLDFWLGSWEVRDPAGTRQGANVVAKTLDGCGVEESWTDAKGRHGKSIFFFDRALARWKQVWVTDDGGWKEKAEQTGALGGSMRFQGLVPRPSGGAALDRTTLTALPGGSVRQVIEQSTDEGATWKAWEGIYVRKEAAAACRGAHRQFDFWIGQWDLKIRARKGSSEPPSWAEARATNDVTSILDGCGIEESFVADGPGAPWAGKSLSRFVDAEGKWRQTWIDDSGSYLTFIGAWKDGEMVLDGEPRTKDGVTTRMRMVFTDITKESLHWRWERTADGGVTWMPMLLIDYARKGR